MISRVYRLLEGYLETFQETLDLRPSFILQEPFCESAAAPAIRGVAARLGFHLVEVSPDNKQIDDALMLR